MIIDEELPLGLAANTAAIMGITLGREMPEIVGQDVTDRTGITHLGVITFPVPILKASPAAIKEIRHKLSQPDVAGVTAVDFPDLAQSSNTYEDYMDKMAAASEEEMVYFGLALCGAKKKVNRLVGSLPLLR